MRRGGGSGSSAGSSAGSDIGPIAALAPDGRLVGLVSIEQGIAKSIINFPQEGERA